MKSTDPHGSHAHPDPDMPESQDAPQSGTGPTSIDPVCGMTVTLKPDTRTEAFGSKDFHFCSSKCQTKFQADPWFYASGR
ncbi:YHS domain-containing protein, partial [Rhodobacteraceae bacterium HSP-20]